MVRSVWISIRFSSREIQPGVVELVMLRRRPKIPHNRVRIARNQRKTNRLINRPRPNMRCRHVANVREIERQQRPHVRRLKMLTQVR